MDANLTCVHRIGFLHCARSKGRRYSVSFLVSVLGAWRIAIENCQAFCYKRLQKVSISHWPLSLYGKY